MDSVDGPPPRVGWKGQPDGRGTMDIVWTCCLTMFLSSWSILCINVPGPHESKRQVLWRKFGLMILGILGPELIFTIAYSQWLSARQSVKDMQSLAPPKNLPSSDEGNSAMKEQSRPRLFRSLWGYNTQQSWTMKEAFFAEMGGFRLRTRDQPIFPLNAKQIHFLVAKDYIDLPSLQDREIEDKNKADGLLRTITLWQITWFLINTLGRWIQNLTVATLEVTTVSFIVCSSPVVFLWWRKPADVFLPKIIDSDISIQDLLRAENRTGLEWNQTPLDFVSHEEWWWTKAWSNMMNILHKMHLRFGSKATPIDRIVDSFVKPISRTQQWFAIGLMNATMAVLFAAWNHSFPTGVERVLWRSVSCLMIVYVELLMLCTEVPILHSRISQYSVPRNINFRWVGRIFNSPKLTQCRRAWRRLDRSMDCVRNNSPDQDPSLYVPLKVILPLYALASAYGLGRLYILVADFVELRSLPADAYNSVEWEKFWPHLQ